MAIVKTQNTTVLAESIADEIIYHVLGETDGMMDEMDEMDELDGPIGSDVVSELMNLQSELQDEFPAGTGSVSETSDDGSYIWKAQATSTGASISETYKSASIYDYDDYYYYYGDNLVTGTSSANITGPLSAPTKISASENVSISGIAPGYNSLATVKFTGSATVLATEDYITVKSITASDSETYQKSGFHIYSPNAIFGGETYTESYSETLSFTGEAKYALDSTLKLLTIKSLTTSSTAQEKSDGEVWMDDELYYDEAYDLSEKTGFSLTSLNGLTFNFNDFTISGQANSLKYSLLISDKTDAQTLTIDESYQSSNSTAVNNDTLLQLLDDYDTEGYDAAIAQLASELFKDNDTITVTGTGTRPDNDSDFSATISAYAGNDKVTGGNYDDLLDGGTGNDTLLGGKGEDDLYGAAGNDSLDGGEGDDYLNGGAGIDNLKGGNGSDHLDDYDGYADDVTDAIGSNDSLDGGNGNDLIHSSTGNDTLMGGNGNDALYDTAGNNKLDGGTGNDLLVGGAGLDTLLGGVGNDILSGNAGNDSLDGGVGNDVLFGGAGQDQMSGGTGMDVFAFAGLDADTSPASMDLIKDFNLTQDELYFDFLSSLAGSGNVGSRATYDLLLNAANATADSSDTQIVVGYSGSDSYVFIDADNTGGIDMTIKLIGVKGSAASMDLLQQAISGNDYYV